MSNAKLNASLEAIEYIKPKINMDSIIGVGTGSTVNFFIEELAKIKQLFKGAVSSSEASSQLLEAHDIEVFELNAPAKQKCMVKHITAGKTQVMAL